MKSKKLHKIPVYIPELKMTVYASPDETIAQLRKKYIGQREYKNQRTRASWQTNLLTHDN
jgi:hypothetical protein